MRWTHREMYQSRLLRSKCRHESRWEKGSPRFTEEGSVLGFPEHARNRTLPSTEETAPVPRLSVQSVEDVPSRCGDVAKHAVRRSLSSPPKLGGRGKAYSFDDEEDIEVEEMGERENPRKSSSSEQTPSRKSNDTPIPSWAQ